MGLFDKIKNKFDDLLYEDENEETIKKPKKEEKEEKIKVEKEEIKEENVSDSSSVITERDLFKTDPKFKFPINFPDDDEVEEEKSSQINALKEEEERYKVIETKTVVEEKRVFRPTPVISPIYGILDKNYKKGDIAEKNTNGVTDSNGKLDLDSVIRKAYGEVEVSKTVTREEKFFTTEEMPIEKEAEINLFETLKEEKKELPKEEKPLSRVEINETEYEEESYDIDEIDKKIKSIDQLLKETADDDFYSLVDSMYKDEEEEK